MAFKYIFSGLFSGQPNDISSYYLNNCYTTDIPRPWTNYDQNVSVLTVSGGAINTAINNAKTYYSNLEHFVWDLEGLFPRIDNRNIGQTVSSGGFTASVSETVIDNTLDSIENLYNATKSALSTAGFPNCKVGFYGLMPWSYYIPVLANVDPLNSTYQTNLTNFRNAYTRLNQRYSGGNYTTKNMSTYVDFFAPEIYPYFGPDDQDFSIYATEMLSNTRNIANGKDIYPYYQMYYHYSTTWFGKPVTSQNLKDAVNLCKQYGNGMILWGGFDASRVKNGKQYTPNVTKSATDWRGITNGSLSLQVRGYNVNVTGISLTSMAVDAGDLNNLSPVALVLKEYINQAINSQIDSRVPTVVARPSLGGSYPYKIGNIELSWSAAPTGATTSPSFFFSANGATGSYGVQSPPDINWNYYNNIVVTGNTAGTNLASSEWLGNYIADVADSPRNSDEFDNGWVVNVPWWETYVELARTEAAYFGTGVKLNAPSQTISVNGRLYNKEEYERLLQFYQ